MTAAIKKFSSVVSTTIGVIMLLVFSGCTDPLDAEVSRINHARILADSEWFLDNQIRQLMHMEWPNKNLDAFHKNRLEETIEAVDVAHAIHSSFRDSDLTDAEVLQDICWNLRRGSFPFSRGLTYKELLGWPEKYPLINKLSINEWISMCKKFRTAKAARPEISVSSVLLHDRIERVLDRFSALKEIKPVGGSEYYNTEMQLNEIVWANFILENVSGNSISKGRLDFALFVGDREVSIFRASVPIIFLAGLEAGEQNQYLLTANVFGSTVSGNNLELMELAVREYGIDSLRLEACGWVYRRFDSCWELAHEYDSADTELRDYLNQAIALYESIEEKAE